jgi:hypothetical protein
LIEDFADQAKVLEVLSDRVVNLLWNIVHGWRRSGLADGQVILGTVALSLSTFASGFATRFVALDERAAQ